MSTATYTVSGMTCGHCVQAVKDEVGAIPGVESVDVALETGAVEVVTSGAVVDSDAFSAAVEEAGYQVAQ